MSAPTTSESTQDAARAHGSSLQRLVMRQFDGVTLYNADCLDILPELVADAIISDPPYGMDWTCDMTSMAGRKGSGGRDWREKVKGDAEPFDPSPWLNYPAVVLFGSNHYAQRLPVGTTLVWIKRFDQAFGTFFSDAEVAWMKGGHGIYCKRDLSMNGEALTRCHPCQKPVPLMAWVMERAKVPVGATVCDPYMGSGSTAIACIRTGRKFIGVEKDKRHFETACERIRCELAQGVLLPHNSSIGTNSVCPNPEKG